MELFFRVLRTKDHTIILEYLQYLWLQGGLTAFKIIYYFLCGVLTIVISIPLVLLLFAIAIVITVVLLISTIVFLLVVMVARLFGKDIAGWVQERIKQKQSNDNDEC